MVCLPCALELDLGKTLLEKLGEKSMDFYFIMVPLRNRSQKKVFKYGTPEPSHSLLQ